jgi:hypothetical protein
VLLTTVEIAGPRGFDYFGTTGSLEDHNVACENVLAQQFWALISGQAILVCFIVLSLSSLQVGFGCLSLGNDPNNTALAVGTCLAAYFIKKLVANLCDEQKNYLK